MSERTYPVPVNHWSPILGSAATLDRIDLAASLGDEWAQRVVGRENARTLAAVLGGDLRLPVGAVVDDHVVGLWRDGMSWTAAGWTAAARPAEIELLDESSLAFVARALEAGAGSVLLLPYTPVALLTDNGAKVPVHELVSAGPPAGNASRLEPGLPVDVPDGAPPADDQLPEGAKVLAVVDQYDRNAVMDLVVVLPGPKVMRRHDGEWRDDPGWVNVLRSVRPPPVVVLDPSQVPDVEAQVDAATKGEPFTETGAPAKPSVQASAWVDRADEMTIEWALLAANKVTSKATAEAPGVTISPKLDRYWLAGPGAAKIRWGTPGAWRRCHRHLSKYVGPERAKGLCTNLGKHLGGKGVAWDVLHRSGHH